MVNPDTQRETRRRRQRGVARTWRSKNDRGQAAASDADDEDSPGSPPCEGFEVSKAPTGSSKNKAKVKAACKPKTAAVEPKSRDKAKAAAAKPKGRAKAKAAAAKPNVRGKANSIGFLDLLDHCSMMGLNLKLMHLGLNHANIAKREVKMRRAATLTCNMHESSTRARLFDACMCAICIRVPGADHEPGLEDPAWLPQGAPPSSRCALPRLQQFEGCSMFDVPGCSMCVSGARMFNAFWDAMPLMRFRIKTFTCNACMQHCKM